LTCAIRFLLINRETQRRFLLRYYRVFNIAQCDLPQAALDKLPKVETHEHDPIEAAELIIANMPQRPELETAGAKASPTPHPLARQPTPERSFARKWAPPIFAPRLEFPPP
jgi:hypothetical protein